MKSGCKCCLKCGQMKPAIAFNSNRSLVDGLARYCRECRRIYRKERRRHMPHRTKRTPEETYEAQRLYYIEHRDEILKQRRQRYAENPEKQDESTRRWRAANPEKAREFARRWQTTNPEKSRETNRRWDKNHPEKRRGYIRRRRARKLGVNEHFTHAMERFVHNFWNHECALCGSDTVLCIDHWLPLSRGHALDMGNAVLLCRSCNSGKRAKIPASFLGNTIVCRIERKLRKQARAWKLAHRGLSKAAVQ